MVPKVQPFGGAGQHSPIATLSLSAKGQTRCKAGTQSHGTHAVSRATEREGTSMFRTQALAVPARLSQLRARVWARVVRPEDMQCLT